MRFLQNVFIFPLRSIRNPDILPLFICVQVRLALVAVVGDLVVHPVGDGSRYKRFPVLQGLAKPNDERFLFGDQGVGRVDVLVEIIDDDLLCFFHHRIVVSSHLFSFLLSADLYPLKAVNVHAIVPGFKSRGLCRRVVLVHQVVDPPLTCFL